MRHNVKDELDMAMYSQEVFRRKYKFMPFFQNVEDFRSGYLDILTFSCIIKFAYLHFRLNRSK